MKSKIHFFDEEPKNKKRLAACYLRVSILSQVRLGHGLDIQEEQCKKYCQFKKIDIYKFYKDEAVTGVSKYDDRKGLSKLMQDAKEGKFNTVVLYSLDRMGRNLLMIGNTIKELQEDLGLEVFSCVEDLELSTEEGKLSMYMFAWISHLELTNIRVRLHQGIKTRRTKDGYIGGRMVYGYCRQDKHYIIHEKQAAIVAYIYDLYHNQNISMNKIAEILTQYKVETPKKKTKKNEKWNGNGIKYILCNYKKYLGLEPINGNENGVCWPKILDDKYLFINENNKLKGKIKLIKNDVETTE